MGSKDEGESEDEVIRDSKDSDYQEHLLTDRENAKKRK